MNRKEVAKRFAAMLLAMKALKINVLKPFKWTSGWFSPVYCNNRLIPSYPQDRAITKELMAALVLEKYGKDIVIAGVATGAIGIGILVADLLGAPFVYVREKAKEHGLGAQIEGFELNATHRVVVVEDLISTGKSSLKVVKAIAETGAEVLGMVGLFTYGFPEAMKAFEEAGVQLDTLSDYVTLMEVAEDQNLVSAEDKPALEQWRLSPSTWMQTAN